jgi:hypothetical protein
VSWSTPDRSLADSVSSSAHRFGFLSMIVISLLPPSSVNRHYEQHQASNGFCLAMINFFSAIVRVAFQLQEEKKFFFAASLAHRLTVPSKESSPKRITAMEQNGKESQKQDKRRET